MCFYCSKINFQLFASLILPISLRSKTVQRDNCPRHFPRISGLMTSTNNPLESLRRIILNAVTCKLCYHFHKIVTRNEQYSETIWRLRVENSSVWLSAISTEYFERSRANVIAIGPGDCQLLCVKWKIRCIIDRISDFKLASKAALDEK